ncbi:hypothetical protein BH20ACT19_BH20ACT19_09430 [soil metagenome]
MLRHQLEHLIRACADLTDEDDIVVVGSQAIHGSHADPPPSLLLSIEADVYPRDRPDRADLIDGAIGEGSPFHSEFEYYAHGVGPETAKAPHGWEQRLVALSTPNTRGATGWCLEAHDLVLAKCVAGREKDWAFAAEAIRHGIVALVELEARVADLPVDRGARDAIAQHLEALGD